ncbi:MAG: 50S ribosomal protein L35 [Candidatus Alcyoniella australis]|nr:50S ribosomal protein L35 [Candidatus Alcyoniella australis]
MPKMKTKRAAAKRLKISGSGIPRRRMAMASHILTKKSTKRKRNLRKARNVDVADRKAIARLLPYGKA